MWGGRRYEQPVYVDAEGTPQGVVVGGEGGVLAVDMNIVAIDPGSFQSACVQWDGQRLKWFALLPNEELCKRIHIDWMPLDSVLRIEGIASYGMPVGKEVFDTCIWIGRFWQSWVTRGATLPIELIYRRDVKLFHCGSVKAKDSNIRQALIDKYGEPGTKKNPGVTFGLRKDLWAAFALATCEPIK